MQFRDRPSQRHLRAARFERRRQDKRAGQRSEGVLRGAFVSRTAEERPPDLGVDFPDHFRGRRHRLEATLSATQPTATVGPRGGWRGRRQVGENGKSGLGDGRSDAGRHGSAESFDLGAVERSGEADAQVRGDRLDRRHVTGVGSMAMPLPDGATHDVSDTQAIGERSFGLRTRRDEARCGFVQVGQLPQGRREAVLLVVLEHCPALARGGGGRRAGLSRLGISC